MTSPRNEHPIDPQRRHPVRSFVVPVLAIALWLTLVGTNTASESVVDSTTQAHTIHISAPSLEELVRQGRLAQRPGRPRVALTLSGGGARGLAQIGVLKAFEDAGIEIELICGVSMGAIVGGLYATGISPDSLESLARSIEWGALLRESPPRAQLLLSQKSKEANWFLTIPMRNFKPQWPSGATSGQILYNFLSNLTQGATYRCEADFDQLPIRYRAVATELSSGRRVAFEAGEIAYAMRAAMAFPLAISPLREDSVLFADGGLVDPLPVHLTDSLTDAPVVAINTASGLADADELSDLYSVANQATTVMTTPLIEKSLEAADYVCTPKSGALSNLDFGAIDSLIADGYTEGQRVAEQIVADFRNDSDRARDSTQSARMGALQLGGDLRLSDCPESIFAYLRNDSTIDGQTLQALLADVVAGGWWTEATAQYEPDTNGTAARWVLTAKRPPIITAIRFDSPTIFNAIELRRVLNLAIGARHDRWAIAAAAQRLIRFYAQRNYTLTDIRRIAIDDSGELLIHIDEARLVNVTLTGNRSVKDWVVLRNFPMTKGSPYNARRVERGLNDLQASGLFDQITAAVIHTEDGPILELHVDEKDTDALRLGLRHDLEYQTDVFIEYASINALGIGNELVAHAQHAPRRDWFFLRAQADRVFRTYLTGALTVQRRRHEQRIYSDHEQIGTFETDRVGVELYFGQNISRRAQAAVRINVDDLDLKQSIDSSDINLDVASIAAIARLDDLDDRDFPTRGRRLTAEVRWADDFLGGDVVYRLFDGEGMWVESLSEALAMMLSARFATAERRLPIFERFGLGGLGSFMGLNDNEIRGDKLVHSSLTGRYRVYTRSYLVSRIDVGTVWDHHAQIDFFRDLRFGIGAGVAFDTPLGPLKIMAGTSEDDYSEFYFSWGYDF
ncbi:MAG: BamA/TamA family outer membrane protein [candidate division Zixibacteria bacterium]|nr:BamA/TamA family outer membrane protein [candidate division Zixibacteria bacterium]